jgi:type I restriction enzyme M protein
VAKRRHFDENLVSTFLVDQLNIGFFIAAFFFNFYAQGVKANVLFFDRKGSGAEARTKQLWIYDLRTNKRFTMRTRPLQRADLDEFVACYRADNPNLRKATWSAEKPDGRWRVYSYEELLQRDKISLDIFWLRDESLESSDNLADSDLIAEEIADDLRAALEQFEAIQVDLRRGKLQLAVHKAHS